MIFQPPSPLRSFHLPASRRSGTKGATIKAPIDIMTPKRALSALEKLHLRKNSSRSATTSPSEAKASVLTANNGATTTNDDKIQDEKVNTSLTTLTLSTGLAEAENPSTDSKEDTGTTNSSPVDPAYFPSTSGSGGHLTQLARSSVASSLSKSQPTEVVPRSFFESDSDSSSEDDEAVFGRASSVRISKPRIVRSNHSFADHPAGVRATMSDADIVEASLGWTASGVSRTTCAESNVSDPDQKREGVIEALNAFEDGNGGQVAQIHPTLSTVHEGGDIMDDLRVSQQHGGLCMHPVAETDRFNIQRAISAPPVPFRHPSRKRVKIRPSQIVTDHPKEGSKHFRETVVTTPYPVRSAEEVDFEEKALNEQAVAATPRSNATKSTRFENDRFPSPDQPEVLFLELGLARHPAATTTLEIRIADQSTYDDEELFTQIRKAYRTQLLGMSRLVFCFIRDATHVTVSPSIEFDFNIANFMKHFDDPRIGRKRKSWVIWLRLHPQQQSYVKAEKAGSPKRPLSASLRSADKRLSVSSDSTSTLNFSFLPPFSLPRLPFFSKGSLEQQSALTRQTSSILALEAGKGIVKIDFHHEFSFWALAFLFSCVVISGISAIFLWTILGVPGSRPGDVARTESMAQLSTGFAWTYAAQTRVLTGLVLGVMVVFLGSMIELCMVAGAFILL